MRSIVPENGVLYGGLNTSKEALEITAASIKRAGFVQPEGQIETFTLGEAGRDPDGAIAAAEGTLVVFHSMGHLASKDIVESGALPASVMSFNRTLPQKLPQLVEGAGVRFGHHAVRSVRGPDAQGHRRIVRDNVAVPLGDWSGNIGRVPEAEHFDSDYPLLALAAERVPLVAVVSALDEFRGFRQRIEGHVPVDQVIDLRHCHDGLLYDVAGTLNLVAERRVIPQLPLE